MCIFAMGFSEIKRENRSLSLSFHGVWGCVCMIKRDIDKSNCELCGLLAWNLSANIASASTLAIISHN